MNSFTINPSIGIGDAIQFTSLPENYFRGTGKKLSFHGLMPWYLKYNPFVVSGNKDPQIPIDLWNFPPRYTYPRPRDKVYLSNAEIHANLFGIKEPVLKRPRLYLHEDFPFEHRKNILFQPFGKSHGALPKEIIEHVVKKYGVYRYSRLHQIGLPSDPDIGIPRISTPDIWSLIKEISECRMFIGIDSGPSWIAACYPDVQIKKIRNIWQSGYRQMHDWVPLEIDHPHSHWDDLSLFKIYNTTDVDVGFTESWRKI